MATRVLMFHYVLTNKKGETIDTSRGGEPFPVMEGARQILPALEEALFKMNAGDRQQVVLSALQAYGEIDENLRLKVDRGELPEGDIEIGTRFRGGPEDDAPVFTVTDISGQEVSLDGNHPLAGEDLYFDIEIMQIREATDEEKKHGHAHGPGGHHH